MKFTYITTTSSYWKIRVIFIKCTSIFSNIIKSINYKTERKCVSEKIYWRWKNNVWFFFIIEYINSNRIYIIIPLVVFSDFTFLLQSRFGGENYNNYNYTLYDSWWRRQSECGFGISALAEDFAQFLFFSERSSHWWIARVLGFSPIDRLTCITCNGLLIGSVRNYRVERKHHKNEQPFFKTNRVFFPFFYRPRVTLFAAFFLHFSFEYTKYNIFTNERGYNSGKRENIVTHTRRKIRGILLQTRKSDQPIYTVWLL